MREILSSWGEKRSKNVLYLGFLVRPKDDGKLSTGWQSNNLAHAHDGRVGNPLIGPPILLTKYQQSHPFFTKRVGNFSCTDWKSSPRLPQNEKSLQNPLYANDRKLTVAQIFASATPWAPSFPLGIRISKRDKICRKTLILLKNFC